MADIDLPDVVVNPDEPSGAAPPSRQLQLIEKYESGGRNVKNPTSSASGPWQFLNSTWREMAPKLGVDTLKYPTAMSAPVGVQQAVAQRLYDEQGWRPWAPYNPRLAAAIAGNGLMIGGGAQAGSLGPVPDFSQLQAGLTPRPSNQLVPPPVTDMSGAGEATASPMLLMALAAAGTHRFVPVSYDPFKLMPQIEVPKAKLAEVAGAPPALPAMPGMSTSTAGASVSVPKVTQQPDVNPVTYITKTGMRSMYQIPGLAPGDAKATGGAMDPAMQNWIAGVSPT